MCFGKILARTLKQLTLRGTRQPEGEMSVTTPVVESASVVKIKRNIQDMKQHNMRKHKSNAQTDAAASIK